MPDLLAPVSVFLSTGLGPGDLELALPAALLVLPAPLLVYWLLPPYRERQASVRVPFFEEVAGAARMKPQAGAVILRRNVLQKALAPMLWVIAVLGMARPEWVEPPLTRVESARDLLLAVDLSGSMAISDFRDPDGNRISRLDAVKEVLDDFITRREGDRLGLVVFGDAAHLQMPFSRDHDAVRALLAETRVAMAGPRTMIGDAIGLAIKLFEESGAEQKVVVLLTDGADTGSRVPPNKAAEIAAERGVTIHTIAVGDPEGLGENRVDVALTEQIARITGGESFLAQDRDELSEIYAELDRIEQRELEAVSFRPRRALFHWTLGAIVILVLAYHVLVTALSLPWRRGSHA